MSPPSKNPYFHNSITKTSLKRANTKKPEFIGNVIPSLLKSIKPRKRNPLSVFIEIWASQEISRFVREHSYPLRLTQQQLIIAADSHASCYELSFYEKDIANLLRKKRLGNMKIKSIVKSAEQDS